MKAQLALQQDSRDYFSSQEMYPKRESAAKHSLAALSRVNRVYAGQKDNFRLICI
jgi:hypothetical protein